MTNKIKGKRYFGVCILNNIGTLLYKTIFIRDILRESYNEMKNETVKRLSNLVRDKELEITSLQVKKKNMAI